MLNSKIIRELFHGATDPIYSFSTQTFFRHKHPIAELLYDKDFKPFCVVRFSFEDDPEINRHVQAFREALPFRVFPVPNEFFNQEYITKEFFRTELAGSLWMQSVGTLILQVQHTAKGAYDRLNMLLESYYHIYISLGIPAPKNSQAYMKTIDMQLLSTVYTGARNVENEAKLIYNVAAWKKFDGPAILKNKSDKEYIRFNATTNLYETTRGGFVTPEYFELAVGQYKAGLEEFEIHGFTLNEQTGGNQESFKVNAKRLDNGDISINCVTISKEEFLQYENVTKHEVI